MSTQVRKLNNLLGVANFKILDGTFVALAAYAAKADGSLEKNFGTLAGALNSDIPEEGLEFIAPILPRNLRLNTAEEVFEEDLDYQVVQIQKIKEEILPDTIVSRHAGTVEYLQSRYGQDLPVLSGNLEPEEVKGKIVIGTLPPHLAAEAEGYIPVRIKDFDYSRDGDLQGDQLQERLVVDSPIKVTVS